MIVELAIIEWLQPFPELVQLLLSTLGGPGIQFVVVQKNT